MKLKAPPDTGAAYLSNGSFAVDADGNIEIPEDTPATDIAGLRGVGFSDLETEEPAAKLDAKTEPKLTPTPATSSTGSSN